MIIDNETKKDKSLSQLQFSSLPAFFRNGCFLKWLYPTTMGFPTKNDHFGVFWGYHHLRKHPNISLSRWEHRPTGQVSRAFQDFQDFQVQRWRLASGFMWWKTRWKLRGFPPGYYPWWPPPGRLGEAGCAHWITSATFNKSTVVDWKADFLSNVQQFGKSSGRSQLEAIRLDRRHGKRGGWNMAICLNLALQNTQR